MDISTESAASVRDKLARYILNPEHPAGASKAAWFQQALGFTRQNSEELARQIVFNENEAVQTAVTKYGVNYNQTFGIVGNNGRTISITTGWIKGGDGVAKLVTALPGK